MTADAPNYAQAAIDAVAAEMPGCDVDLVRLYALLSFTKGAETTLEDVHDAWSLWRTATRPDHRSIRPFGELAESTRELDRPYVEAIHRAAAAITGKTTEEAAGGS